MVYEKRCMALPLLAPQKTGMKYMKTSVKCATLDIIATVESHNHIANINKGETTHQTAHLWVCIKFKY